MIGPIIDATLPLMRAHTESLMCDRCDIERGFSAWDEEKQASVTTWAPVHTAVPCHFEQAAQASASTVEMAAGESVTPQALLVKVPFSVSHVRRDDRVSVRLDGEVVTVWVTDVVSDTHAVERVLRCRRQL